MENSSPTAYHCPSCGALTQAASGEKGQVVCRACGYAFRKPLRVAPRAMGTRLPATEKLVQRDVVSRRRIESRKQLASQPEAPPASEAPPPGEAIDPHHVKEEVLEDGTRKVMKRRRVKRRNLKRQFLLIGLGFLVVAFTALSVREFLADEHVVVEEDEDDKEKRIAAARAAEMDAYVQKHIEECYQILLQFLRAPDTTARTQFVWDPRRVTPQMTTYYLSNLARRPEGKLTLERSGLRLVGEVPVIETLWRTEEGERMEVAFVRSDGRWAIDWEEFVRYGSMPWLLFVDGADGMSGEFRLYMRRRKVLVEDEGLIGLQFYPPRDSHEMRQREQSPRVLVREDSEEGRKLVSILEGELETPGAGESFFPEGDPDGMVRVRVMLEWEERGEEELFLVLGTVEAGNWWGDGFDPPEPSEPADSAGGEALDEEPARIAPGGGA